VTDPQPGDEEVCQTLGCGHRRDQHREFPGLGLGCAVTAPGDYWADTCNEFRPAAPSEPPAVCTDPWCPPIPGVAKHLHHSGPPPVPGPPEQPDGMKRKAATCPHCAETGPCHPGCAAVGQDDDTDWLYNEASGILYAPWPSKPGMRMAIATQVDQSFGHAIAATMNAATRPSADAEKLRLLRGLAEWLVAMDDDDPESIGRQDRRTVTLTAIIDRALAALDGERRG